MKWELFVWQPTLMAAMQIICMTTDSDGYHMDIKFKRKCLYHFSPWKVVTQKTKLNIECLWWSLSVEGLLSTGPTPSSFKPFPLNVWDFFSDHSKLLSLPLPENLQNQGSWYSLWVPWGSLYGCCSGDGATYCTPCTHLIKKKYKIFNIYSLFY